MIGLRNRKGSITVEAAIILPVCICVIVGIGFFTKVVYVHEMIQHAINDTANEIAGMSYLITAGGLQSVDRDISDGLKEGSQTFEQHMSSISDGYRSLTDFSQDADQAVKDGKNAADTVRDIVKDPVTAFKSMVCAIAQAGYNEGKGKALGEAAKFFIRKHLKTAQVPDVHERLLRLNIVDGFEGLDFGESLLFAEGTQDIDIVVRYRIDLPLPFDVLPDIYMIQRATARAWLDGGGDLHTPVSATSVWDLGSFERGWAIQKMQAHKRNLPRNYPVIARFANGRATMIKSINLNDKTYQKAGNLKAAVKSHINRLDDFKGADYAGTKITEGQIRSKQLILVLPKGELDRKRLKALEECKKYAGEKKIMLKIERL